MRGFKSLLALVALSCFSATLPGSAIHAAPARNDSPAQAESWINIRTGKSVALPQGWSVLETASPKMFWLIVAKDAGNRPIAGITVMRKNNIDLEDIANRLDARTQDSREEQITILQPWTKGTIGAFTTLTKRLRTDSIEGDREEQQIMLVKGNQVYCRIYTAVMPDRDKRPKAKSDAAASQPDLPRSLDDLKLAGFINNLAQSCISENAPKLLDINGTWKNPATNKSTPLPSGWEGFENDDPAPHTLKEFIFMDDIGHQVTLSLRKNKNVPILPNGLEAEGASQTRTINGVTLTRSKGCYNETTCQIVWRITSRNHIWDISRMHITTISDDTELAQKLLETL